MIKKIILLFITISILLTLNSVTGANFEFDNSTTQLNVENATNAGGNNIITLKQGNYTDKFYNLQVKGNVTIKGDGEVNLINTNPSNSNYAIYSGAGSNLTLINVNIINYKQGLNFNGINLNVQKCNIKTESDGIYISGGKNANIEVKDSNVYTSGEYGHGLYLLLSNSVNDGVNSNSNNVKLSNNTFTKVTGYGHAVYLLIYGSENFITIIDNNINRISPNYDYGHGLYFLTYACKNNITILNNNITSSSRENALYLQHYNHSSGSDDTYYLNNLRNDVLVKGNNIINNQTIKERP